MHPGPLLHAKTHRHVLAPRTNTAGHIPHTLSALLALSPRQLLAHSERRAALVQSRKLHGEVLRSYGLFSKA